MSNMFSENAKKEIPKKLDECYKQDNVTLNLWKWSAWLEKWGKVALYGIIIIGLILSVAGAISTKEVTYGTYYTYTKTETDFNFLYFVTTIVSTVAYAIIEYVAYHILALLVGALADIVQHTRITADVALYNASKHEKLEDINSKKDEDIKSNS